MPTLTSARIVRTLTIAVLGTLAVLMPVTSQPAQAQSQAVAQEMAQAPMPLSFPGSWT